MQIQHPTASLIAKVATAQDDITGDGTTSNVLIIGELLKQADRYISEGLHPRIIAEGFEEAKKKALEVLDEITVKKEMKRDILLEVARTSLQTKVHAELADVLVEAVVDSVLTITRPGYPIDLFMVEIMEMKHKSETDTKLIRGLVLDHGARHPEMKKRVENAYILICNVSLEYEKTLTLACGGIAVNSLEDLSVDSLGHAGLVHEYAVGEEKFTFVEDCVNPRSVTLLVKGPNKHTLTQIKDAVRDGLRAIRNAIEDGCVVPGAGAVEVTIAEALIKYKHSIKGRARLGVQAFADALLIIPKVLAQNSGYDPQETLVKVQTESLESEQPVGIDLNTGEPMVAADAGVWDNYCVKKQLLHSCTVIAANILLVDEIMRAGMSSLKG
uniref:Chaperonin containing TCP1 subunit 6B n=1 Tax=Pipistrellus kuhlii TaxID=59472 RepID=A0A7J7U7J6_PIPKU|nr:chaperonin containing TCP1 subunit 6B [Pipistrellus kuhlii]